MVRVDGMTAQAWEMEGRSGMAFRAGAIRSVDRALGGRRRRRDDRRDGGADAVGERREERG